MGAEIPQASIRGVIFDLDGVLVTTDEFHHRAWRELAGAGGPRAGGGRCRAPNPPWTGPAMCREGARAVRPTPATVATNGGPPCDR